MRNQLISMGWLITILAIEILAGLGCWWLLRKIERTQHSFEAFRGQFFQELHGFHTDMKRLNQWATLVESSLGQLDGKIGWQLKLLLWGSRAMKDWKAEQE